MIMSLTVNRCSTTTAFFIVRRLHVWLFILFNVTVVQISRWLFAREIFWLRIRVHYTNVITSGKCFIRRLWLSSVRCSLRLLSSFRCSLRLWLLLCVLFRLCVCRLNHSCSRRRCSRWPKGWCFLCLALRSGSTRKEFSNILQANHLHTKPAYSRC